MLITRPQYDPITKYFCVWSQELVDFARAKHVPPLDLKGKKAVRSKFDSYVKKQKPGLIFLNGHGNALVITGHDNEVIVDANSDLSGAIIYARSCDAGQILGYQLVKSGAKTFIGYKRKFICGYSHEKITKPAEDDMAKLFLEPSNLVVSTLLKDHSAQDANTRSKTAMYRNFRKMISSASSFEERYAARWLWSNLNNQVLIGSGAAFL